MHPNDNGHAVDIGYDGANRRVSARDALADEVDVSYDGNSNPSLVVEKEVPSGGGQAETFTTTNDFDSLDRLKESIDNAGHTRALKWDSRGNRVRLTDAENNVTRWVYDGLDRVTQTQRDVKNPLGQVTKTITVKQGWDGDSRLASTTDDSGNETQYHWDALDRLEEVVYADSTVRRRTFTLDDQVDEETDQNGTKWKGFYDDLDRLTLRVVAPARSVLATTTFEKYRWDGLSRMTHGENDASVVEMAYDSLSRVIEETQNGRVVKTQRDGVGNPVSVQYPGGRTVTRAFDALERVQEIDDAGGGAGAGVLAQYTYKGPWRPGTKVLGNGVAETCLYDNDRRVTSKVHARASDGGIVAGWTYAYNNEDQKLFEKQLHPSSQGPAGSGEVYQYDSLYRLTSVKYGVADPVAEATNPGSSTFTRQVSYGLDGVGNRGSQTETNGQGGVISFIQPVVNTMNEYTSFGAASEGHDKNGNRVEFDTATARQSIVYDFRDRPVQVYQAQNGGAEQLVASYSYDVFNRRIEKNAAGQGDVQYFYDGWRVVEEQSSGVTVATYVDGPQYLDEHVSMDRGGQRYFFHANTLYSVAALTDSFGNVVEGYSYDVYGTPTFQNPDGTAANRTSSAFGNPYLFTGQRFDPESGLYNYRSNYLDPTTGRYICHDRAAADPFGNLYTYAGANPTNSLDAFGERAQTPEDVNAIRRLWDYDREHGTSYADSYIQAVADAQGDEAIMWHDMGGGKGRFYVRATKHESSTFEFGKHFGRELLRTPQTWLHGFQEVVQALGTTKGKAAVLIGILVPEAGLAMLILAEIYHIAQGTVAVAQGNVEGAREAAGGLAVIAVGASVAAIVAQQAGATAGAEGGGGGGGLVVAGAEGGSIVIGGTVAAGGSAGGVVAGAAGGVVVTTGGGGGCKGDKGSGAGGKKLPPRRDHTGRVHGDRAEFPTWEDLQHWTTEDLEEYAADLRSSISQRNAENGAHGGADPGHTTQLIQEQNQLSMTEKTLQNRGAGK